MFNFNFGLQQIDGFGDFDYSAFEAQLSAIASVATVAAVNSPAVVDSPKGTAPDIAQVEQVVQQVVQAVAPVVAPRISPTLLAKLEAIVSDEVVYNPQVVSSSAGQAVSQSTINTITSSISDTFKNDAQKDAELNAELKQVATTLEVDERTQLQAKGIIPTPTNFTLEPENVRDPITGLTPAQVEAKKALDEAVAAGNALGIKTTANTATAGNVPTVTRVDSTTPPPADVWTGEGYQNEYKKDPLYLNGKLFTGTRNGIQYKDGLPVTASREDVLQANREAEQAAAAAERAKNPLYNYAFRPAARLADDNYIYYYSWIGGVNTGQWEEYRAPNTPENAAKYLSRAYGGATQGTAGGSGGINTLQIQPTVTPEGKVTDPGTGNTAPGSGTGGGPVFTAPGYTGSPFTSTGSATPTTTTTPSTTTPSTTTPSTTTPTTITPVVTSTTDPATLALIQSLQSQIASLTAKTDQAKIDQAAANAAAQKTQADNAIAILTDRFTRYGLASLIPKIKELAIGGATEATITLQLQDTEEYRQRFIANQDRLKKGLAVLDPGTYIGLEDRYRQILRAYGLKQFDNDSYVTQFLANDVSPEELSSRVVTAVQRVQNADPTVSAMLRQFYGIGTTDMVAYVLDPAQQFPKIERQVAAAEIGVAAARQGLTAGVNVAEQLAAQGITEAQAQKGYATIADILPGATKLSEIYTGVLDQYGQAEAEQEVFNSLASAQRKRRRLTEREIGTFSGSSGVGRGSLSTQTGGTF
jgi:hypothetical protein